MVLRCGNGIWEMNPCERKGRQGGKRSEENISKQDVF